MKSELRTLAASILNGHRIMTVATNRKDGWPQATTVGYVNEGLILYFFVARLSQKYSNIANDPKVSVAVGSDFTDPSDIKGISLAGTAEVVPDGNAYDRAAAKFIDRFPEYADWPRPNSGLSPLMKITPKVISIVDYSRGFGHSDLVTVEDGDIKEALAQTLSEWFGKAD